MMFGGYLPAAEISHSAWSLRVCSAVVLGRTHPMVQAATTVRAAVTTLMREARGRKTFWSIVRLTVKLRAALKRKRGAVGLEVLFAAIIYAGGPPQVRR
jgi:hypothetical protein